MGNGLGKHDKKVLHVNKANSYPQSKRGRRATIDGFVPHLNLEVESKKAHKFGTGNFKDSKLLQQQIAEFQLNSTIRRVQGEPPQTANGSDGSEAATTKPSKKKGSKLNLFIQRSLTRNKLPPSVGHPSAGHPSVGHPSSVGHPLDTSPYDSIFEVENEKYNISNSSSSSSLSPPQEQAASFSQDDLSQLSKQVSMLSEDSEYMSSSVSSSEVGRDSYPREGSFGNNSFVDFDNVVGYSDTPLKNNSMYRARGRAVSDSLYNLSEGSKDTTIAEIQRATENEKKKNRRFQELSKVLAERNNIIIDLLDLNFIRKVGEGAFSEVWEGVWNGVHVAIKKLKSMVDDELFQERFLREVESLRKGNHQNVVMFFGVCLRPACIVTEFMAGGNLYDLLHKAGARMSTALVVKLALDLAVGLLHLHSLTILHRDLTSLNVLLDEMGNIKISDFGLSREKTQEGSMTMTLGGICNPRWRPPEITKNIGHYSEKVDVYSFALVVWEILTGELPFANLDGPQAAAQVAYTNLRPLIPATCPAPLQGLIQRCWVDDAKSRPDFKEIVEELKAIQFSNPMGFASDLVH